MRFAGAERPPAADAFDMIFLDPPYGAADAGRGARHRVAARRRQPRSSIIEHARRDAAPESGGALVRTRELTSGDSALAFYTAVRLNGSEAA